MEFQKFIEWLFYAVLGGSALYAVSVLQHLKTSIDQLNVSVATLIENKSWVEKTLEKYDERITALENKT